MDIVFSPVGECHRMGLAMAIKTDFGCNECRSPMELSDPALLLDFNLEGRQEPFCSKPECGHGLSKIVSTGKTGQSTFIKSLSKKKIMSLYFIMCRIAFIEYPTNYSDEQNIYMDVLANCESRYDLIEYFTMEPFSIGKNIIESKIPTVFN